MNMNKGLKSMSHMKSKEEQAGLDDTVGSGVAADIRAQQEQLQQQVQKQLIQQKEKELKRRRIGVELKLLSSPLDYSKRMENPKISFWTLIGR